MPHARPMENARPARLDSIDLLRGLVMVIMAIDHTRDYFHYSAIQGIDPTDLGRTSHAIFFTRWITHYCAPTFSFLAGTGVFLSATRGKTKGELSWFLVTRGAWLVLLELTFFYWAWNFALPLHGNWGLVIWALGWSMIFLAALIHLPLWAVAAVSLVMIAGHNALDGIAPAAFGSLAWLWHLLHVPGTFTIGSGYSFLAFYPLIPWLGVMSAGYAFGALYTLAPEARRAWLWRLGIGALAAFVILRAGNLYGDARPWSPQPRAGFGLWSFLNVTKYPPSLLYLLMTLGPGFVLLAAWDRGSPRLLQPFVVFGRVPFFYYALHIPLIHALSWLWFHHRYGRADFFVPGGPAAPAGAGFPLWVVYAVWASVILALYPACRWFADYKRRHRDAAWLSYI
ncbi:MAG TPA: heparan-alpha-glucosaminide N-acetyltransferase domain-containing protein [Lacunisphaera sp.]|nr:heparan-alpha-glucosaminide N-acetyltransferase domain-containing protein [Lacunisphaera sp.]